MRLIDADHLIEELNSLQVTVTGIRTGKGVLCQIINEYQKSVLKIVNEQPTADVVPISEVKKLNADLEIWKQNRFNLYQKLECYAMMREKVARGIFEDIENHCDHIVVHLDTNASPETFKSVITQVCDAFADVLAELKKKHLKGDGAGL